VIASRNSVEVFENVSGAGRTQGGEERLQLVAVQQFGDVGEIGRMHLLRLRREVGR
jgi:hypothetical protein